MNKPHQDRAGTAGGFFIALLTIAGAVAGGFMGQPTIGLLSGLALGTGIALAMWLMQRNR